MNGTLIWTIAFFVSMGTAGNKKAVSVITLILFFVVNVWYTIYMNNRYGEKEFLHWLAYIIVFLGHILHWGDKDKKQ